jgi:hypothetical protein
MGQQMLFANYEVSTIGYQDQGEAEGERVDALTMRGAPSPGIPLPTDQHGLRHVSQGGDLHIAQTDVEMLALTCVSAG